MIFGTQISVKLSGAASGGTHAIMELVTPARSGPPMHLHEREDQTFYVLEGQYRFELDGKRIPAGPGSAVYVPRGTAHAFRNNGNAPGRMLVIVQPAGLEDLFEELAEAGEGEREPTMSVVIPILRKYRTALLGLPLEA